MKRSLRVIKRLRLKKWREVPPIKSSDTSVPNQAELLSSRHEEKLFVAWDVDKLLLEEDSGEVKGYGRDLT